ncbi:hypothetical protein MJO29_012783 [Puccinia striiformis f. sp. tritici]|nr:hypothetical protein Pst134EB_024929 [Puccinia striiformis f. sp. tritici]KAI7942939.1 hypothetical protein MJO29_012783 [Puccinia striiformis f. sp. tritici]
MEPSKASPKKTRNRRNRDRSGKPREPLDDPNYLPVTDAEVDSILVWSATQEKGEQAMLAYQKSRAEHNRKKAAVYRPQKDRYLTRLRRYLKFFHGRKKSTDQRNSSTQTIGSGWPITRDKFLLWARRDPRQGKFRCIITYLRAVEAARLATHHLFVDDFPNLSGKSLQLDKHIKELLSHYDRKCPGKNTPQTQTETTTRPSTSSLTGSKVITKPETAQVATTNNNDNPLSKPAKKIIPTVATSSKSANLTIALRPETIDNLTTQASTTNATQLDTDNTPAKTAGKPTPQTTSTSKPAPVPHENKTSTNTPNSGQISRKKTILSTDSSASTSSLPSPDSVSLLSAHKPSASNVLSNKIVHHDSTNDSSSSSKIFLPRSLVHNCSDQSSVHKSTTNPLNKSGQDNNTMIISSNEGESSTLNQISTTKSKEVVVKRTRSRSESSSSDDADDDDIPLALLNHKPPKKKSKSNPIQSNSQNQTSDLSNIPSNQTEDHYLEDQSLPLYTHLESFIDLISSPEIREQVFNELRRDHPNNLGIKEVIEGLSVEIEGCTGEGGELNSIATSTDLEECLEPYLTYWAYEGISGFPMKAIKVCIWLNSYEPKVTEKETKDISLCFDKLSTRIAIGFPQDDEDGALSMFDYPSSFLTSKIWLSFIDFHGWSSSNLNPTTLNQNSECMEPNVTNSRQRSVSISSTIGSSLSSLPNSPSPSPPPLLQTRSRSTAARRIFNQALIGLRSRPTRYQNRLDQQLQRDHQHQNPNPNPERPKQKQKSKQSQEHDQQQSQSEDQDQKQSEEEDQQQQQEQQEEHDPHRDSLNLEKEHHHHIQYKRDLIHSVEHQKFLSNLRRFVQLLR